VSTVTYFLSLYKYKSFLKFNYKKLKFSITKQQLSFIKFFLVLYITFKLEISLLENSKASVFALGEVVSDCPDPGRVVLRATDENAFVRRHGETVDAVGVATQIQDVFAFSLFTHGSSWIVFLRKYQVFDDMK
jgi:hypothetical protein